MGLITKTVKIKWNTKTKKYYEEKGYFYTKINDEFDVKVQDLTDGSHALVEVQCDCEDCTSHTTKPIKWQDYKKNVKKNSKYYCNKCAKRIFGDEKTRKTRLLKSKSFYDWCIENNKQNALDRWDYELNGCSPKEVSYGTSHKKYYFKCPKGIHPSELKSINNFIQGHEGSINCKECNSFQQWCINNNRQDVLDRWDYKLNKLKPNKVSYASGEKYYFKCSKELHPSELKQISNFISGHEEVVNCKACNSIAQWGIDNVGQDFLNLYWDYEKNNKLGIDPWQIAYASRKKIWIKCQNKDYHGSYEVACFSFTNKNSRCPYCVGQKVHKLDSLGYLYPQALKIWDERNKKSPYECTPKSHLKVWWNCLENIHNDFLREISSSVLCEFRCPNCVREQSESILQEKVRLYLEDLKYIVLHENNCTLNPKNIIQPPCGKVVKRSVGVLRYDNEIVIGKKHLVIEINGQQHYQISNWHKKLAEKYNTTPELELKYQQDKDKYKKKYALSKGYEYLEIPYWTDDENEAYKKLIDNKINEILHKINQTI